MLLTITCSILVQTQDAQENSKYLSYLSIWQQQGLALEVRAIHVHPAALSFIESSGLRPAFSSRKRYGLVNSHSLQTFETAPSERTVISAHGAASSLLVSPDCDSIAAECRLIGYLSFLLRPSLDFPHHDLTRNPVSAASEAEKAQSGGALCYSGGGDKSDVRLQEAGYQGQGRDTSTISIPSQLCRGLA